MSVQEDSILLKVEEDIRQYEKLLADNPDQVARFRSRNNKPARGHSSSNSHPHSAVVSAPRASKHSSAAGLSSEWDAPSSSPDAHYASPPKSTQGPHQHQHHEIEEFSSPNMSLSNTSNISMDVSSVSIGTAPVSKSSKLSNEKRQEILDRLQKEREDRRRVVQKGGDQTLLLIDSNSKLNVSALNRHNEGGSPSRSQAAVRDTSPGSLRSNASSKSAMKAIELKAKREQKLQELMVERERRRGSPRAQELRTTLNSAPTGKGTGAPVEYNPQEHRLVSSPQMEKAAANRVSQQPQQQRKKDERDADVESELVAENGSDDDDDDSDRDIFEYADHVAGDDFQLEEKPSTAAFNEGDLARTSGRLVRNDSPGRNGTDDGGSPKGENARLRPTSAPRNRYAKEKVVNEVEAEFARHCTFRPQINQISSNLQRQQSLDDRIAALSKSREAEIARRQKEKLLREKEEMKHCTFRPEIVSERKRPSSATISKYALREHIPADERLFHDADNRVLNRERAKRHQEESQMQEFSFTPRLEAASVSDRLVQDYKPVHERVGDLQRKKHEQIARAKQQSLQHPDLTFAPAINETSEMLAARRSAIDVAERLHSDSRFREQQRAAKADQMHQEMAEKYTFAPAIDSNSQRIAQQSETFSGANRDFLERQMAWMQKQKRRQQLDVAISEREHASNVSFHPQLPKATEKIASLVNDENEEERFERLAFRDKKRAEELRSRMHEQYYSQFSFKPEINHVSKQIAKASTVDDLVSNERNKKVKQKAIEEAEKQLQNECPFKPSRVAASGSSGAGDRSVSGCSIVSPLSVSSPSSRTNLSNQSMNASRLIDLTDPTMLTKQIEVARKEKERRLDELRKAAEYEQLRECTFKPEVKGTGPKQAQGPILIRGLGRYLERQENARKKVEDLKEREEKAFMVNVTSGSSGHPFTIPQPFQLHSGYHSEVRRERIKEELRRRELEECTFHPKTNEAENRQLIAQLLDDDQFDQSR
eukprot:ANDGO_04487.mRNA.1 hypothetical protein PPTG_05772